MPAMDITIPEELVDLFSPAFQWYAEQANNPPTIEQWSVRQIAIAALPILERYQEHQITEIAASLAATEPKE
jgi:hypothetical protein